MCSLVVLLTNKQAIYCTVKCFILTPYRFLALWLLQVYPLKATQTINQNSIPSHSIWIYSLAGKHTAFIDADGGDIYLCRGEETTLCMWIYAFRQVAVCRQETPIKRFYWSCLETHSVLHIYRGTVIFFEEKYRGKSLAELRSTSSLLQRATHSHTYLWSFKLSLTEPQCFNKLIVLPKLHSR